MKLVTSMYFHSKGSQLVYICIWQLESESTTMTTAMSVTETYILAICLYSFSILFSFLRLSYLIREKMDSKEYKIKNN